MVQEKTSGIKLHIGVNVLGLPHTLMVTAANVTDQRGAADMIAHYCDVTEHLSRLQKVLADGGYTGEKFANEIKEISGAGWRLSSAVNSTRLPSCLNAGLRNVLSAGSISAADF